MKIRNGFVTNSSSSSFIIGKANDNTVTIDSVYQEIKEFYKQYYKSCSEMYSYVEEYYPDTLEEATPKEDFLTRKIYKYEKDTHRFLCAI